MDFTSKNDQYLDTVRALHQTVISLRSALENSRSEIIELKSKKWPIDSLQNAITALSVENHALRQKIIDTDGVEIKPEPENQSIREFKTSVDQFKSTVEKLKIIDDSFISSESEQKRLKREETFIVSEDKTIKNNVTIQDFPNGHSSKLDVNLEEINPQSEAPIYSFVAEINKSTIPIDQPKQAQKDSNKSFAAEINKSTTPIDQAKKAHKDPNKSFASEINKSTTPIDQPKKAQKDSNNSFAAEINVNTIPIEVEPKKAHKSTKKVNKKKKSTTLETSIHLNESFEKKSINKVAKKLKFEETLASEDEVDFEPISTSTPRNTQEDARKITVSINLDIYKKTKKKSKKIIMEEENKEPKSIILQHSMSTDLLNQELDNIELIFTNEDTKDSNLKEEMISIDGINEELLTIEPNSGEASDKELEDDVFNDNFENENQENSKYQTSTRRQIRGLKKSVKNGQDETEFQNQLKHGLDSEFRTADFSSNTDFQAQNPHLHIYSSKSDNSLNHDEKSLRSCYSYQDSSFENKSLEKDESFDRFEERVRVVETDMSKVGIHDVDYGLGRRNTCPNPLQYRPFVHREALGKGLNSRKTRPILAHSNAARRESGAQTDISALPNNNWRSESSLAYKARIGENFTTLPSKYPHPGTKLRLSEKTVESRRVLLSDIGFTSMVPELSRSADHLCPNQQLKVSQNYGQFLRTPDYSPGYTSQKFTWNSISPFDSHSQSRYSSLYPLASPPCNSQTNSSVPAPYRRCSAPVSPCRHNLSSNPNKRQLSTSTGKLVRFANGSMPELRSDWGGHMGSSDSTDSLVDEAEQYLRRSIDNILLTRQSSKEHTSSRSNYGSVSLSSLRRASAPEPSNDSAPPHGWRPFLPRQARDIRLDNWVKVISPEGRVRGGRVRYVGHLLVEQADQFVGVQLSTPEGPSDGSYNNRRYFQW